MCSDNLTRLPALQHFCSSFDEFNLGSDALHQRPTVLHTYIYLQQQSMCECACAGGAATTQADFACENPSDTPQ